MPNTRYAGLSRSTTPDISTTSNKNERRRPSKLLLLCHSFADYPRKKYIKNQSAPTSKSQNFPGGLYPRTPFLGGGDPLPGPPPHGRWPRDVALRARVFAAKTCPVFFLYHLATLNITPCVHNLGVLDFKNLNPPAKI